MENCIICGREIKKGRKGRHPNVTCSKDCSKIYNRIHSYIYMRLKRKIENKNNLKQVNKRLIGWYGKKILKTAQDIVDEVEE